MSEARQQAHFEGQRTPCRLCGRPILWLFDANGKLKPYDADVKGRSHFTTCPEWREMCRKRDEARRAAKDALQGRLF